MFSALLSLGRIAQTLAPTSLLSYFSWGAVTVSPPVAAGITTAAIVNDVGHRYIPNIPGLRMLSSAVVTIGSVAVGTGAGFLTASALSTVALPVAAFKVGHVIAFAFIVPKAPAIYSYVRSWIPYNPFRKTTDRKD